MVFQGAKIRRARLTRHSWCVRRTLIWLKVVKQARDSLVFLDKLRDDSQAPAGRDALATLDHSDIRGLGTA